WEEVTAGPVFSPDGRTFAIATAGGKGDPAVRLIEWASRAERQVLPTPTGVGALAYSRDGRVLASGHADTTVLLWDLTSHSGPRPWTVKPTPAETLWQHLRGQNATVAHRAMVELVSRPATALALLRQKLQPATARRPAPAEVARWIER